MTRDEVADWCDQKADRAGMKALGVELLNQPEKAGPYQQHAKFLRAAAELIRQGGWRPIAEAPEGRPAVCGKHLPRGGDWLVYRFFSAAHAAKEGYTHYLPEPEPPAREVENG